MHLVGLPVFNTTLYDFVICSSAVLMGLLLGVLVNGLRANRDQEMKLRKDEEKVIPQWKGNLLSDQ